MQSNIATWGKYM